MNILIMMIFNLTKLLVIQINLKKVYSKINIKTKLKIINRLKN